MVTATIGLGEALVGGEATGEQWIVHDGRPVRDRRATVEVLGERQAVAVAALARRVEAMMGGVPQDISGRSPRARCLLQARPMTALPDPCGGGCRGLADSHATFASASGCRTSHAAQCNMAVAPARAFASEQLVHLGVDTPRPLHVLVNGWYFYSLFGSGSAWRRCSASCVAPSMGGACSGYGVGPRCCIAS